MTNVIIIGAGGLSLEVVDLIESINKKHPLYHIVGILDDRKKGYVLEKYQILGTVKDIEKYKSHAFIIAIANPKIREKIYQKLQTYDINLPNLISPNAEISRYTYIKDNSGVIINYGTQISANAVIGKGAMIDSQSYIGHGANIGDYVTLYPSVNISGETKIENFTQIGLGTNIIQGLNIGAHSFIGAGSTVISDIPKNVIAVGAPCRVVKENKDEK